MADSVPQDARETPPISVTLPGVARAPLQAAGDRARGLTRAIGRELPLRIIATILLLLITAAALLPGVVAVRRPRPTFSTAAVGSVVLTIPASGTIAATAYQADFPEDGTLAELDVTMGQQVRKGDTLAKLDVAPFQSALDAAQSAQSAAQQAADDAQTSLSQAQNAVSSAQSALSAQQDYASTECSAQPPDSDACAAANAAAARGQAQLDAANAQAAAAQAQTTATQKTLTSTQNSVALAQAQLADATLVAPHDGVVTAINGLLGGRPGATTNGIRSFITIVDTSAPLVNATVGYTYVEQAHAGEAATLTVPQAKASAVFAGAVTGVSPEGQGAGARLSYPVYLHVDPATLAGVTLLPGMSVAVKIVTHARYHVVVISNGAVSYARHAAPPNGNGLLTHGQVVVAQEMARTLEGEAVSSGFDATADPLTPAYLIGFQKNAQGGKYVAIPVVLGLTDGRQWEVVSGLVAGQQVVDGQQNLLFPSGS